jgi:ubiquinone biosynthesis protein UbiJ
MTWNYKKMALEIQIDHTRHGIKELHKRLARLEAELGQHHKEKPKR